MNNNLKDRLDQHQSKNSDNDLDWDALGPAIMSGIEQKKKSKRRVLFWFFGTFLLVMGLSIGWYSAVSSDTDDSQLSKNAIDYKASDATENKPIKNNDKENSTAITIINKQDDNPPNDDLFDNKNNHLTELNRRIGKSNELQITSKSSPDAEMSKRSESSYPRSTYPNDELRTLPIDITDAKQSIYNSTSLSTTTIEEEKSTFLLEEKRTNQELSRDLLMISRLNMDQELMLFDLPPMIFINPIATINIPKASVNAYLSVDSYYSSTFSNMHAPYEYASRSIGSEFGMNAQYTTKRNLRFSVGINRSTNNFRTAFDQEESIKVYQPETIDTIFVDRNGVEFYSYKDSADAVQLRAFGHTTTLTSYNLPLGIGYVFGDSDLRLSILGGPILTFYQALDGRIADPAYTITNLENSGFGIRIGMHASVSIEKHLSPSHFLLFGAQAARIRSRDQNRMINSFGLRIGAGWKF